jgi:hypothetical protein
MYLFKIESKFYLNINFCLIISKLGIGDWAQSPIPNPQSPIPNPPSPFIINNLNKNKFKLN